MTQGQTPQLRTEWEPEAGLSGIPTREGQDGILSSGRATGLDHVRTDRANWPFTGPRLVRLFLMPWRLRSKHEI